MNIKKPFYFAARKLLQWKPPSDLDAIREKKMLLEPGRSGKELTDEYFTEKTATALMILTAGAVLAVILWISDLDKAAFISGNVLERNGYGEGNREVEVDLYTDDELYEKKHILTVSERRYTEEEIREIFDEIGESLSRHILGENKTPDHVDRDLNLMTVMEGYPVGIEWMIDNYTAIDGDGRIRDDYRDEEGVPVKLTAILTYGKERADYEFYVHIFPKARTEEEEFAQLLEERIAEYDEKTVSYNRQLLPDTAAGKAISYRISMPKNWLYVLLMAILAAAVIYIGKDKDLDKEVQKREREMMLTYPEIVSKLTLLLGAGMTVRAAFEKTVYDRRKNTAGRMEFAYEEMLITVNRMKSGVSEYEAYLEFGKRCAEKRFIKLGALLAQDIRKGNQALLSELEAEAKEAFEDRKAIARKMGEEAGTRLLMPMAMMLLVVMIVVIVPAFLSFG